MWQVYGQDHILKQLELGLEADRVAHAYLLVGPPHVGKMTLALALAQGLNCEQGPGVPCNECNQCRRIAQGIHADLRVVTVGRSAENGPSRTVIGINDVKDALRQTNLKPYEGRYITIIFDGAELMSEEAANALLKTLEEPPPQVLISLLTTNEDFLLSTIKSRCRRLDLLPVPKQLMIDRLMAEYGADDDTAERLVRLSRGCMGWAISALNDSQVMEQRSEDMAQIQEICESGLEAGFSYAASLATRFATDRGAVREVLFLWLRWWRDLLLVKEDTQEYIQNLDLLPQLRLQATKLSTGQVVAFIRELNQTVYALERNANPRLALEVLMLNLPRLTISV